jgi:5-methylcytosine-specific restriction endonuclease McrA
MERHYMALSAHARRRVRERDHGVCALCGVTGEWEADHIIPLAEGRTLCVPCHKAETRALAGRLAQRRADYKAPRLDLK